MRTARGSGRRCVRRSVHGLGGEEEEPGERLPAQLSRGGEASAGVVGVRVYVLNSMILSFLLFKNF